MTETSAQTVTAIRNVKVSKLREWDRNPRRIEDTRYQSLVRSLREDPEMLRARPLIAMKDGRVIAGNMRLAAARDLGWDTVPTVYVDLDEDRAATWALRDNNPYGEWDDGGLADLLSELRQKEVDLDLTGIDDGYLAMLTEQYESLRGSDPPPPAVDDRGTKLALADVSIGDPKTEVASGDVWTLGPHVMVCAGVYEEWDKWLPFLEPGSLFVPYPTPTLPLTERALSSKLVLVQPDTWLAGHLIDKYAAVNGPDSVSKR